MRLSLLGIFLVTATLTSSAYAKAAVDAAYDKHSQPVYNSNGECVRTIWQNDSDPCAPAQKEAPKQIVHVMAPPPPPALPEVALEQRTVYFDFNRAALTDEAKQKLDGLATIINNSSAIADVRIHGFTDQIGTKGYNDILANKRAKAVKAYLDTKSRLKTTVAEVLGLGKSSPTEGCGALKKRDEKISCMAKERRVEIEFKAQK